MKKFGPYKLQKTFDVVTVPKEVRQHLGIQKGDSLFWIIDDKGQVILKKAEIKIELV